MQGIYDICKEKISVATKEKIPPMAELLKEGWRLHKVDHNCQELDEEYGIFRIICKEIDMNSDKPNFVAMAGASEASFCGSTKIITDSIALLSGYRAIYIICWDTDKIKNIKNKAFENLDKRKKAFELNYPQISKNDIEYRTFCYEPEIDMYSNLGFIIDKILKCLQLKNVHLLGKSMGGGVALHTVSKSDIYTKLFLAVPAGCQYSLPLEKLGERLNHFRCIVGWNDNDVEMLSGLVSTENLPFYETEFKKLKEKYPGFSYEQHMFKNGNGHEINPKLIEIIGRDL